MRSELVLAINQLCAERRLPPDVVKEALQAALASAYKRNFGGTAAIDVRIDLVTGEVRVYAAKEVVAVVEDAKTQITLADARCIDTQAQLGQTVLVESTPRDFGRIAAQAAKQVILQRIREAEREMLFSTFAGKEGEIASGTVQSIDLHSQDVVVNLDGVEALLPAKEQVPTEKYRRGARIRVYVLEVKKGSRGPQITLSRRTPLFLRGLMEMEVPEIFSGTVEIKNITREPGSRSKVAVRSTQEGVDPVGSCVGVRGTRIQKVVDELGGEKIDVVQWSSEPAVYIGNALSPAKVMNVRLDEVGETRTATVIVPDRQLSLAIGKEGQNARLAAKLTGWRIDIKSASEVADEALGKLSDIVIPPEEMGLLDLADAILQKRDSSGLTKEEEQRVAEEVERGGEAGLRWPEQEPAGESRTAGPQPTETAGPGEGDRARGETEGDRAPTAEGKQPAQAQPQPAGTEQPVPAAQEPGALPVQEEPVSRRVFARDEELLPTFEGEPVEESSGWVQTAPQGELYSGWEDGIEEAPENEDTWDREEPEEEAFRPGKKRKKKSGKSRFGRTHTRE